MHASCFATHTTPFAHCIPRHTRIHRQPRTNRAASAEVQAPTFEAYLLQTHDATLQVDSRVHSSATQQPSQALEHLDGSGKQFVRDRWQRSQSDANAGYGITCVLEDGNLIEKVPAFCIEQPQHHMASTQGAVNITVVNGTLSPQRAAAMSERGRVIDAAGGQPYAAAAMSLVLHPAHPLVPTLRGDVRVFSVGGRCWYGGGCDLTPAYLFEEDAAEFHSYWRDVCDAHCGSGRYAEFKAWCDRYFYLAARGEHRGVGGVFFDDLEEGEQPYDVRAVRGCW